jgi:hypothetical protein
VPKRRGRVHSHGRGHSHADGHTHDHGPEPKQPPGFALDAVLEVNGEWHDRQTIAGSRDPNSGGNVVYLSPGIRVSGGNVSGFTSVGLPIANEMNGLQSKPSHRVLTGLAVGF